VKTAKEIFENFTEAKYALFLEVGNMEDINNMDIVDFTRLNRFIEKRNRVMSGKSIPLKDSNREMIRRAKAKLGGKE